MHCCQDTTLAINTHKQKNDTNLVNSETSHWLFFPLLQRTKRTTYTCLQRHAKIPSTLFYYQWKHLRAQCFSCFSHSFLLVFRRLCHKVEKHRCWAMSNLNSTLVGRTTRSFQMTQLDPFRNTVTGLTCGGLEGARVIRLSLRDEAVASCVYLKTIAANNKAWAEWTLTRKAFHPPGCVDVFVCASCASRVQAGVVEHSVPGLGSR